MLTLPKRIGTKIVEEIEPEGGILEHAVETDGRESPRIREAERVGEDRTARLEGVDKNENDRSDRQNRIEDQSDMDSDAAGSDSQSHGVLRMYAAAAAAARRRDKATRRPG